MEAAINTASALPESGYFFLQRLGLVADRRYLLPKIVVEFLSEHTLVFFRYGNQRFLQKFTLKPSLQVARHSIDEPLLFRYQEGLVFGIEYA